MQSRHYFDIFLIAFLTATSSAATTLITVPAGGTRDWIGAGLSWVVTFAGTALAAIRALEQDPPKP